LILAEAMAAQGASVTLANGGLPGPWTPPSGVEIVQLPPILARNPDLHDLVDLAGAPPGEALWRERCDLLLSLLWSCRPQVVMTEMFPFGRRAFSRELLPLLEAVRTLPQRTLIAASVRDILVSKPKLDRYRWMAEVGSAWYDIVLVHGDEQLMPFAASFPLVASLKTSIVHTGFVHQPAAAETSTEGDNPAVLVSAGGGAVGERLLQAALEARARSSLAQASWLLVAGQNLAQDRLVALMSAAPSGCEVVRYRPDLSTIMGRCCVSVSQAGYNTVVEGLKAGARMVLVPFGSGGEDEQARRAARLQALGLAECLTEEELTPASLAAAIDRMARCQRPSAGAWSFAGAATTAEILRKLVDARS
jgi:predicted glycosyltransferase